MTTQHYFLPDYIAAPSSAVPPLGTRRRYRTQDKAQLDHYQAVVRFAQRELCFGSCVSRAGRARAAHSWDKDGRCVFCDLLLPQEVSQRSCGCYMLLQPRGSEVEVMSLREKCWHERVRKGRSA